MYRGFNSYQYPYNENQVVSYYPNTYRAVPQSCCSYKPMQYNYSHAYQYPYMMNNPMYMTKPNHSIELKDYGPEPFVVDIEQATNQNNNFRTALWTGTHLQLTLMSINPGESIGLENHPNLDQFIRVEQGQGLVLMGDQKDRLDFQRQVFADYAFIIPAGKWHNLINTGNEPIKLYSIYAPIQHPYGTVHQTKQDALAAEE